MWMRASQPRNSGSNGFGKFLDSHVPLRGELDHVELQWSGNPGAPSTWTGTSTATIASPVKIGPVKLTRPARISFLKMGDSALTPRSPAAPAAPRDRCTDRCRSVSRVFQERRSTASSKWLFPI